MAPILPLTMLTGSRVLLPVISATFVLTLSTLCNSQETDTLSLQQTGLKLSKAVSSAIQGFFVPPEHDQHEGDFDKFQTVSNSSLISLNSSNSTPKTTEIEDEHTKINRELAEDEERVLAKGEVKIRKKRTYCKRCYQTPSYGYGGGGSCCGACGQCGGGYQQQYRPVKIKVVHYVRPVYSSYGGGGGGCCNSPCGVCGRK